MAMGSIIIFVNVYRIEVEWSKIDCTDFNLIYKFLNNQQQNVSKRAFLHRICS